MRLLLRLLPALLTSMVLSAGAQTVVTWVAVDGMPYHERLDVQRIEELGRGQFDERLRQLAAALPQYRHRVQSMSRAKLWRDMRGGVPLCYADAFKTPERLGFAHFVELAPSPRLVVAAAPGRLPPGAELSLRELLQRPELRGAFELERSYGELIDRLLQSHGQTRRPLPGDARLLRMLEQGRMDYVLEYPTALLGYERKGADTSLDMRLIAEDRQPAPTQVACSHTVDKDFLRALDAAVRRLAVQEAWLSLQLRVYPATMREAVRPQVEQYFRERAQQQAERIQ